MIHNSASTNRSSTTPAAAPALTARASTTSQSHAQEQTAAKAEHIPATSAQQSRVERRRTIRICMLLIIKGSRNRKRSRHSIATTKRRPVPGRRTAKPARKQLTGTLRSATSRATRRRVQRAHKTTPTARQGRLTHMLCTRKRHRCMTVTQRIRNPRVTLPRWRVFTILHNIRK